MFMLWLFTLLLLLPLSLVKACPKRVQNLTIKATEKFFGKEFPFWYNIALAEVESNCRWFQTSYDGHGSVGYFQLTPKFLDHILRPYFPYYTENHLHHFYAFAFYIKRLYETTPTKKLWIVYQRYNGGDWVLRECERAKSSFQLDCLKECRRGNVCVWRTASGCKQYRSACEINYSYSVKIFERAQKYRKGLDYPFIYW